MRDREFEEVVEEFFPYDGPHSGDSVAAAARGAAELVRYLNNATRSGGLARGPVLCRVVGGVEGVVGGLDQLLGQLAERTRVLAGDATLYDDRRDRPGARTARQAASGLEEAREWSRESARALAVALGALSCLGHDIS